MNNLTQPMATAMDKHYDGEERRKLQPLSDEQIDAVAERAAEVALERVYTQIGRSVVSKVMWLVGAGALALAAWLAGKGGHLNK